MTSNGGKEIVLLANDIYWYPSRLMVLQFADNNLSLVTEYWNPGLLYTLNLDDLNDDGTAELIVTGVNNDLQGELGLGGNVYAVFMLDGSNISGQAPPYYGRAENGTEVWYSFVWPKETRINDIDFEDVNGDGRREVHISLSDACSFFINYFGQIIRRGYGSACEEESSLHFVGP